MALMEIKELCYEANGKKILKDINLTVEKGEIHSVMGVNGAGKTTLAYVITGLKGYEPCKGSIIFNGEDITKLGVTEKSRKGITLAWQSPASFEGITVREYLSINNEKDPAEMLKEVGLNPEEYLDRNVDDSLSGGERKRIELASVMSINPKLVILDEPDSGIDLASIDILLETLKKMKEKGTSILLITHNDKMASIGDRVSLMCNGMIVKQGKPENVARFFKKNCSGCEHVGEVREEKLNEGI